MTEIIYRSHVTISYHVLLQVNTVQL